MSTHLLVPVHPPTLLVLADAAPAEWGGWLSVIVALVIGVAFGVTITGWLCRHRTRRLTTQVALWRYRARHDELTGLPNRAAAYAWFQEHRDRPHGVVFADLDDFKNVNDRCGHATGDAVLRLVAQRLACTVSGYGVAARLGGDEFLLLVDRSGLATALAQQAAADLSGHPMHVDGDDIPVTASFGVATTTGPTRRDVLLSQAEQAAYQAKQAPGGVVEYHDGLDWTPVVRPRPPLRRRDTRSIHPSGQAGTR